MPRSFQHSRVLILSVFLLVRPRLGLCGAPIVSVLDSPTKLPPEGSFMATATGLPFPLKVDRENTPAPEPDSEQEILGVMSSLKAIHQSLMRLEGALFAPPLACAGASCNQTLTRPFDPGHRINRPGLRRQILSVDAPEGDRENTTSYAWDQPDNTTDASGFPSYNDQARDENGYLDAAPDEDLPRLGP